MVAVDTGSLAVHWQVVCTSSDRLPQAASDLAAAGLLLVVDYSLKLRLAASSIVTSYYGPSSEQ